MAASGVTFSIPTLNEERRLARCLSSIRSQEYPQDHVEIIVADGGSRDSTVAIARGYGARVVHNEQRLAEPGVALGMSLACHEYCVAFAADNVLPHNGWLSAMTQPLDEHPAIGAAFTHIVNAEHDNAFNRYFNALHADPFNAFVFADAATPRRFHRLYRIERSTPHYTAFRFSVEQYPLLALAQGFMVRRTLMQARSTDFDDILPILRLIEDGIPMAYVPSAGVQHFSMSGLPDFARKYNRRITNAMEHSYMQRMGYLSTQRKIRQYLWPAYALSIIAPAIDALRWTATTRRLYYAYHPAANLILALLIAKHMTIRLYQTAFNQLAMAQPSRHRSNSPVDADLAVTATPIAKD